MKSKTNPFVLPFLWMKGENQKVLLEEIERIYQTGIREICIESRPHPHFLEEQWWNDMDFVMEEAKKREMKIWLLDDAHFPTGYANGLIKTKYPERKKTYLAYNLIDIIGKSVPVEVPISELIKPVKSWRDLDKKEPEELQNNQLISVTAFKITEDKLVYEEGMKSISVPPDQDFVEIDLPLGEWRIVVVYETALNGGRGDYINIINRESVSTLIEAVYEPHYQRYHEDFGNTFAGFFSDEPGFGNTNGFNKDERIGHKDMALPWSGDVQQVLSDTYGAKWKSYLPFLWLSTYEKQKSLSLRLCYMDTITKLYQKNFSEYLGDWCRERSVEYIGHVIEDNNQHTRLGSGAGHYFRAMSGQTMAGIDTIGSQIIPGGGSFTHSNKSQADGEFFHYALAKLADSSAQLDENKKGRALCELFGAYGWKLGLRDMFWITNHLLARGITHFVPHAFSMAEYPDVDCPPHFYARGNNPQYSYFHHLITYMKNLSEVVGEADLFAEVAVLYHAESEWLGDFMTVQKPARALTQKQIDFLFVSNDMLKKAKGVNDSFSINNHKFQSLMVPYSQYITTDLIDFIKNNSGTPIYFVDAFPESIVGYNSTNKFIAQKNCQVVSFDELVQTFERKERFTQTSSKDLVIRHFEKNQKDYYFLFNESLSENAAIELQGNQTAVEILDFNDFVWKRFNSDKMSLLPYEAKLIRRTNLSIEPSSCSEIVSKISMDISANWEVSTTRAIDYPNFQSMGEMEKLFPISKIKPTFSGIIAYQRGITLDKTMTLKTIEIEHVYESCRVWIDDQLVGDRCLPPYNLNADLILEKGEHEIRIEVSTTLDREQRIIKKTAILPVFEPSEPTGMFGKIILKLL